MFAGLIAIIESTAILYFMATQFFTMFDKNSINLIEFFIAFEFFDIFKNSTTEVQLDDINPVSIEFLT